MTSIRMKFEGLTQKQLDNLFKAEKFLHQAGVSFDTGFDINNQVRDWELDDSLDGATVVIK